ncbi:MAG: 3' terminal RNA ribose 2'-O-methyltransferase Hen1 [Desulfovibrio sp.]|nr:3' terminal RNA ribose 2'-O-methyltransferase Hen1 [Desulfovibrio sp.]
MLLTITCAGPDATDLSWLLSKRPDRFQSFELSFGRAYVFFPDYSQERSVVSLLLEVDEKGLNALCEARDGEFQFVNPARYLSSSLLSQAISRAFSSAMRGVCEEHPALPAKNHDFVVEIANFSNRRGPDFPGKIFAPMGWEANFVNLARPFAEKADLFGNLTIRARTKLSDLLSRLYILLPVFDRRSFFWIDEERLKKFIRFGRGWLETHPEKRLIINEYFHPAPELRYRALEAFDALAQREESKIPLRALRMEAIGRVLADSDTKTVIDLGCGEGPLIDFLRGQDLYSKVAGMDASPKTVEIAGKKLGGRKHEIFQGSVLYRDRRLTGFDAAVLSEVLEHFEPERADLVMENILGFAKPRMLVVTTPNKTYNSEFPFLEEGCMRHPDHRREFDEAEFASFCRAWADKYDYDLELSRVGDRAGASGYPTLMGVFRK